MTWSSSLLLMQWAQSALVVRKQPWGSLANHLRLKESLFSLVRSKCSLTNSSRELSTSLRLQDSQMGLGGPPLGQSVESTVTSGA